MAIEAAAFAIAAWAILTVPGTDLWMSCLLGWTLLTLAWIDGRTMLLPDGLTLPLLAAGLAGTALEDPASLAEHAAAAAFGYVTLAGIAWGYRRLRGFDGLGLGDAKLFAAIGAWLGLGELPITLFLAACIGLLAAAGARLAGKRMIATSAIPFGPCLALAGWLSWLYGDRFGGYFIG